MRVRVRVRVSVEGALAGTSRFDSLAWAEGVKNANPS